MSGTGSAANSPQGKTVLNPGVIASVLSSGGKQLSLSTPNGKVSLPQPQRQPTLEPNKQVALQFNTGPSGNFLEVSSQYNQQRLALTPQQTERALQTVLRHPESVNNEISMSGKVLSSSGANLKVQIHNQSVDIVLKNTANFQSGNNIKLNLGQSGGQWQVTIAQGNAQQTAPITHLEVQKILESLRANQTLALSETGKHLLRPMLQEISSSQLPDKIPQISLQKVNDRLIAQMQLGGGAIAKIPVDQKLLASLSQLVSNQSHNSAQQQELLRQITTHLNNKSASPEDKQVHIYKNPIINAGNGAAGGKPEGVSHSELVNTIQASKDKFKNLNVSSGNITDGNNKHNALAEKTVAPTEIKLGSSASLNTSTQSTSLSSSAQQIINTVRTLNQQALPEIKESILNNLTKLLQSMPASVGASHLNNPEDVLSKLKQLTDLTSHSGKGTLNSLNSAMEELFQNSQIDPDIKTHIKQAMAQVRPETSGIPMPDMQSIKQLLTASALPLTPVTIVSPPANSGMMAGLINLLQVSLSARLNRQNNTAQEKITQSLSNILGRATTANTASKSQPQSLKELSSLEQKHNLSKLVGELAKQHSSQKLQNAERTLQGQEAMHYVLPFQTAENQPQAELLIQKEPQDESQQSREKSANKAWLLTMKLPIGALGEILTKSKVTEDKVEVDLYTSTEELKNHTLNYLPLLKTRLKSLGIELEVGRCERGNIPEKLAKNPYQLVETRV